MADPIGILGGTFDPIHHAHLRLAIEAREALGLATVSLIPAGQPPHRDVPGTGAADRLAMVSLAVTGIAGLTVDEAEVRMDAPSYTVTTLERLRALHGPDQPLVLITGVDAFMGLPSWHRWESLLPLAHIAVATRPGYALEAAHMGPQLAAAFDAAYGEAADLAGAPAGRIVPFAMTALDISATAIRQALAAGRSARFLLPDSVLNYIEVHHLY
ncbi:MAG: nicotinate-nucleotide adenylyltransferase [Rhodocyclaceae bacterium]